MLSHTLSLLQEVPGLSYQRRESISSTAVVHVAVFDLRWIFYPSCLGSLAVWFRNGATYRKSKTYAWRASFCLRHSAHPFPNQGSETSVCYILDILMCLVFFVSVAVLLSTGDFLTGKWCWSRRRPPGGLVPWWWPVSAFSNSYNHINRISPAISYRQSIFVFRLIFHWHPSPELLSFLTTCHICLFPCVSHSCFN